MEEQNALLRFFRKELRRRRQDAGWTQDALAMRLEGWTGDTVNKIEVGKRSPTLRFAQACDRVFPKADGSFERLALATGIDGDEAWFTIDWVTWEERASVLKTWQGFVWPGLLQTENYARAVNLPWLAIDGNRSLDEDIKQRLGRQALFDRPEPPFFSAIVWEPVLSFVVGPPDLMRGQLEHVLNVSDHPRVSIQVLPTDHGAHVGLGGAFVIAGFADDTPGMVYLESLDRGAITRDPGRVARMEAMWNALRTDALSARASRDKIRKAME